MFSRVHDIMDNIISALASFKNKYKKIFTLLKMSLIILFILFGIIYSFYLLYVGLSDGVIPTRYSAVSIEESPKKYLFFVLLYICFNVCLIWIIFLLIKKWINEVKRDVK